LATASADGIEANEVTVTVSASSVPVCMVESPLCGMISDAGAESIFEVGITDDGFLRCLKIARARSSIAGL